MDMRTYGKDFEKYYDRAEDEQGVRFIRSRVHTVDPVEGDQPAHRVRTTEGGEPKGEEFDMVVLSVGLQTGPEAIETARRLGVDLTGYNFTETSSFAPVGTSRGRHLCLRRLCRAQGHPPVGDGGLGRGLRVQPGPGREPGHPDQGAHLSP